MLPSRNALAFALALAPARPYLSRARLPTTFACRLEAELISVSETICLDMPHPTKYTPHETRRAQ